MCQLWSAIRRGCLSVSVAHRHHSLTHSFYFFFCFFKRGHSHTDRLSIKYDLTIGFPLPVNICPLMWAHPCCQSRFCPRPPVRNQFKRRGRLEQRQHRTLSQPVPTSCVFNCIKEKTSKKKKRGAVMAVFHPRLICSFYCAIVEPETSPCLQPIQLNLMHVKERAFHTPGT